MSRKMKATLMILIIFIIVILGILFLFHPNEEDMLAEKPAVLEEMEEESTKEPVRTEKLEIVIPENEEEIIIPIDFEELKEQNEDIYAWISIGDTNVEYPILQSQTDDGYYLDYTVDRVYGLPGSIYTEKVGGQDFEVFNTIVYGHNMKDDSMFGGLNEYRDIEYMKEHEYIMIYTEDSIRTYQVFLATTFSDVYLQYAYDFENADDCTKFLEDIQSYSSSGSVIRDDVAVTSSDRIITMSTCIANQPNNRLFIVAVLIDEQIK